MSSVVLIVLITYTFFFSIQWLRKRDADKQREFELKITELKLQQRFMVAPLVINLCNDIQKDENISDNDREYIEENLQLMIVNIINDNPKEEDLKRAGEGLRGVLEKGNLTTELVLRIKQVLDVLGF